MGRTHAEIGKWASMVVWRFAIAMVGVCALMGFAPAAKGVVETPPTVEIPEINDMQLVRVVKVIDGDTVVLDIEGVDTRFELLAINAPEYIQRDPTPRAHAREAWFVLSAMLAGESVYIHQDPAYRENAAGRMTGFLFRSPDLLFVNQEMVRQGYAEHEARRSTLFAGTLSWWQQHAEDAHKGLWSKDPVVLIEPAPPEPVAPALKVDPVPATLVPVVPVPARTDHFVYLTKSGSKYHTKDCRYYSASCRRVTMTDARKEHGACKVCKPDEPAD